MVVHVQTDSPDFRLGTVLATSFTATLTERAGERLERIPTPQRLADWLEVSGLAIPGCTVADLELARGLREAIHAAATAAATGTDLPPRAVATLNDHSTRGRASATLTAAGAREWHLSAEQPLQDALGVIAADAIAIVSGARDGRLALCASPTCRAAFFDTSRSRSRRWCDMNTCGNKEKKARLRARGQAS